MCRFQMEVRALAKGVTYFVVAKSLSHGMTAIQRAEDHCFA